MHHCVATYIDRVAKGETTILFLRKKQNPETPFYTMEVNNGAMIQCRAKYNGPMTEEVKEFVELFQKKEAQEHRKESRIDGGITDNQYTAGSRNCITKRTGTYSRGIH